MDYDKTTIATTYDAARGYRPEAMRQWLDLVAAHAPVQPAADRRRRLRHGPLHASAGRAIRRRASSASIRPSACSQARARKLDERPRGVQAGAGRESAVGGRLRRHGLHVDGAAPSRRPAGDGARMPARAARARGASACATARATSSIPQSRFFPGHAGRSSTPSCPRATEVVALFEGAGLRSCAPRDRDAPMAASWQEFADKLALRADSFLARLPDAEFEAGIGRAARPCRRGDAPEAITEQIDFFVFDG